MIGNYRGPESMLPFAEKLSASEKKKCVAEWRRRCWRSPRFVGVFSVVCGGSILFFVRFMPAWEIAPDIWSRCIFGLAELGVAYVLAEFVAFGISKRLIADRVSIALRQNEKA